MRVLFYRRRREAKNMDLTISFWWDITSHWVRRFRRFGRTSCLHLWESRGPIYSPWIV